MTRTFTDDERRARLGVRHLLADATQVSSLAEAASALVVLHATDPATVFLEGWARMRDASPSSIERELYEEPTVLRMLAMRRTLFLVPTSGRADGLRRRLPRRRRPRATRAR